MRSGPYIYDFVKIKVKLDEHYYIFSRFLIMRILTLCRVNIFFVFFAFYNYNRYQN